MMIIVLTILVSSILSFITCDTTTASSSTQPPTTGSSSGDDNATLYFVVGIVVVGLIILAFMTIIFIAIVIYLFRKPTNGQHQDTSAIKYNKFRNNVSMGDVSIQQKKKNPGFGAHISPNSLATATLPNEGGFDNQIPSVNPIIKEEFQRYAADKDLDSHKQEFMSLYTGEEKSASVAFSEDNRKLNRFRNIVPFDDNRVMLKDLDHEDCRGDYINASYVDGYSVHRKFIATQGPTTKTMTDFMRMIWLEKVHIIVMMTNLWEGGRSKCDQYWPSMSKEGTGESREYGPFTVTLEDETTYPDYIIRTMKIQFENQSREVIHYQFTSWPDHGVLEYPSPLILVHKRVMSKWQSLSGPLLMHCSAGVGRTGTFITMDIALEQVQRESVVDIAGIVTRLRQQRAKMVQTEHQYKFLHDAILEVLTCGDTEISSNKFVSKLTELKQSNVLESQFTILPQVTPDPDEITTDTALAHPEKNRSTKYLPAEMHLVSLPRGEYINASFVKAYGKLRGMIIAQSPMQNTVTEFWKMIIQHKVSAVVMCCDLLEEDKDTCFQYWKGLNQPIIIKAQFKIMKTAESNENGFIKRTFSINALEFGQSEWTVDQFQISKWSSKGVVTKPNVLLKIIEDVTTAQINAGGSPIVVHCSDTVSRSGVYCAVSNAIEQCKAEGVVDVFQTVKTLRMNKPGAVTTLDQYTSIHDTVSSFLKNS